MIGARGQTFEIRDVPLADSSPFADGDLCNESQERYVLAVDPTHEDAFRAMATRETMPVSRRRASPRKLTKPA